jgi:hypothetical protein
MADAENPPTKADIFSRAVITASPKFAGSAMVLYEGFRDRRQARMRDVELAVRKAIPADEDLAQRLSESEELDTLLNRALAEAAQSAMASKRRLLGKIVANALLDDAQIDLSMLFATVLAQIETPHIRAMVQIRNAVRAADAAGERSPRARVLRPSSTRASERRAGPNQTQSLQHLLASASLRPRTPTVANQSWSG